MTAEEENNNKYMANVGAPLEHFPELDDLDLNADTLEFEPISRRRVKPKRFAIKLIIGALVAVFFTVVELAALVAVALVAVFFAAAGAAGFLVAAFFATVFFVATNAGFAFLRFLLFP